MNTTASLRVHIMSLCRSVSASCPSTSAPSLHCVLCQVEVVPSIIRSSEQQPLHNKTFITGQILPHDTRPHFCCVDVGTSSCMSDQNVLSFRIQIFFMSLYISSPDGPSDSEICSLRLSSLLVRDGQQLVRGLLPVYTSTSHTSELRV